MASDADQRPFLQRIDMLCLLYRDESKTSSLGGVLTVCSAGFLPQCLTLS
jgi:hypothetical protein